MAQLENLVWEKFCQLFANDAECFNNGTLSYMRTKGWDETDNKKKNTAAVEASILLRNIKILLRINELFDVVLTDEMVDRETAFVALQHDDLSAKMAAIREHNKVKGRIVDLMKGTIKHEFVESNKAAKQGIDDLRKIVGSDRGGSVK